MLRGWPLLVAPLLLGALALSCGGDDDGQSSTPTSSPTSSPVLAPTPMTFAEQPEITISADKKYFATVETAKGAFRIELRPDLAIQTVNSFIFLAREGFYDGVTFDWVIPGLIAQGGDPTGTGSGGPGYKLPDEFSDVPFERGTVAMANTGHPNSSGSQFFITYTDQPNLDGQYTVFGKVIEGMEVVDSLTPRDPASDPNAPPGDTIITITIQEG
jgi:peptidylprolyl isomerase